MEPDSVSTRYTFHPTVSLAYQPHFIFMLPPESFFLDPKMLSAEAGFLGNCPAQWFQVKALPLLLLLPLLTEEMVCEQNLGENS